MLTKELLRKIRRIEIRTSHLVNDALAGQYHSAFKGRGMEFEEVRPYQIGDDVRAIDWNVTARNGVPFIKKFREERELTVMLVADLSGSQWFGTDEQLKRDVIAEVGATLAFSAIKNNDKVGLICFTDRIERFVPPRKGTAHVLRVIRDLVAHKPAGRGTNIAAAIDHLNHVTRRRAVVFLISDFQDDHYEMSLRIAKRRHDLILIDVSDRRERVIPNVGMIEVIDPESGRRQIVDTSSRSWRRRYEQYRHAHFEQQDRMRRRHKLDCIRLQTGQSIVEPIVGFFRKREARR